VVVHPELTGSPIDALPSSGIQARPAQWGSRWGSENARVDSNPFAMTVNRNPASRRAGVRISEWLASGRWDLEAAANERRRLEGSVG
jgi:hypothetical protein